MSHEQKASDFEDRTEFVKRAAATLFDNDQIAEHVYNTIKKAHFDDTDQVLDDLDRYMKAHIISKTTQSIRNDLDIKRDWTNDDKRKLYEMLINIYKNNILNIEELITESTHTTTATKPDHDPFNSKVLSIVYKINKTKRKPIDINNVKRLFSEDNTLKAHNIIKMAPQSFVEKAQKYQIKPHNATHILTELQYQYDTKYADKRERMAWTNGSKCEIYSNSQKTWFKGEITDAFEDAEGEWLDVRYFVNGNPRSKQIQRYNEHIRPQPESPNAMPMIMSFNDVPSVSLLERQRTVPLRSLAENAQPLWMSKRRKGRRRSTSSMSSIPGLPLSPYAFSPSQSITSPVDTTDRDTWNIGTKCETYSHKDQQWMSAEIIKIYEDNGKEWLLLKCSDTQIVTRQRYGDGIRAPRLFTPHAMTRHRRQTQLHQYRSYFTTSQLPTEFDQRSMTTSLQKLEEVIDVINHEIDSTHNFLYQVYHVNDRQNIEKHITYEHNEAMTHYNATIQQKYSTSMLCNGKTIYEYGKPDICQRCTDDAETDYNKIYESLHSFKLDKYEILNVWRENANQYDQKWLLSVKKEEFVADAIDRFSIDTVQNAIKLYEKLVCAIKYGGDEVKQPDKTNEEEPGDIMRLWTKKDTDARAQIEPLDHIHFLYIVSIILEDLLKTETRFKEVDTNPILRCLYDTKMNGLLFSKIDEDTFIGSVIIHSHSFKEVKVERLSKLVAISTKLYRQLKLFQLESIKPSSIFSIPLKSKAERPEMHVKEFDMFEQWMITFDSQYNRSTPFNQRVFKHLIDTYRKNPNLIINMKYDNYGKDLNQKTYDDVLKSFISWSITTKCGNLRCEEQLKLCCFCDINEFQKYTYNIIMGIIALKANNKYSLLNKLTNMNATHTVTMLSRSVCDILHDDLKQQPYFKQYTPFIVEWINFDFYNFQCEYCRYVNKTIMIDRVYQYAKTMDCCRVCNKCQMSRVMDNKPQFNMKSAIHAKEFDINEHSQYEGSEFNLHSLFEYLEAYGVDEELRIAFRDYVDREEYDSDALMEDIKEPVKEQSNIYGVQHDVNDQPLIGLYRTIKKYLNYDQYPTYKLGKLFRYIVLRPKYYSLLKEICLNDIHPLSFSKWELQILPEVMKQYIENINGPNSIFSNDTDKRFGIETNEPLGIQHLVAIFLFIDARYTEYQSGLSRSYWLFSEAVHCNNFYWTGRYLYEAVQFYGQKFSNSDKKSSFMQGVRAVNSFDCMSPVFSLPTLTTNDRHAAQRYAGQGSILSLKPKYVGNIDNSKFLFCHIFNTKIRLLNGTKVQIRSIQTLKPTHANLDPIILAIQYLEKILHQTQYDVHFYNSDGLYKPKTKRAAYRLIMDRIGKTRDHKLTDYARHLFDHWCIKRDFVTFETFKLERNYMEYDLKEFLFDTALNKINIINVKKFLPNLKHYNDINGKLRKVREQIARYNQKDTQSKTAHFNITPINEDADDEMTQDRDESFGLLYNCQSHDIPVHIVNALDDIHFDFSACDGVLREAFRMKLSNLDINHDSFFDKRKQFIKQLKYIGISEQVATYCIDNIKQNTGKHVHARTSTKELIGFILELLQTQFGIESNVRCDLFTQKEAFKRKYSDDLKRFIDALDKKSKNKVTITTLYDIAKEISIFDEETAMKLSKYLYIKMMDDKEKIVPWECQTCQFLNCQLMVDGLWRHYNEGNKCGLCGDSRYIITNKVTRSKSNGKQSSKYLLRRKTLAFMRVNTTRSLSTLTPSSPRITSGLGLGSAYQSIRVADPCAKQVPDIDQEGWNKIEEITECRLFKSVKHLTHKQFVYVLENHFFDAMLQLDKVKRCRNLLIEKRANIISYFVEKEFNGSMFEKMKKGAFCKEIKAFCKESKLHSGLIHLYAIIDKCDLTKIDDIPHAEHQCKEDYEELMRDCPAYRKVTMILKHFEAIDTYYSGGYYPYDMNMYL
eukprot:1164958_1